MLKSTLIKKLESSQVRIENEVLGELTTSEIMGLIRLCERAGVNITVSPRANLNVINENIINELENG